MPRQVTLRTTLVLIATAFCLALAVQAFTGRSSAPKRVATADAATLAEQPGPQVDLALSATPRVPALQNPIKPKPKPKPKKKRKRKPKPARVAAPAPVVSVPTATATPDPTPVPTPRYVPTPRPYVPPARTPAPKPKPPATPEPSGDFDTSGEP